MAAAILCVIVGVGFVLAGLGYVRKARAMRSFRSTRGTVTFRDLVVVSNTREGVYGAGGGDAPRVRYRYSVDGRELEGNKISYAPQGRKRSIAEADLARIPSEVTVWYAPHKPEDAYLERHTPAL